MKSFASINSIRLITLILYMVISTTLFALDEVGRTEGIFKVNQLSGAATYSLPIKVAPGVGSFQPSLSLDYNSQVGMGLAGFGWNLSGVFSAITRCPESLVQDGKISSGAELSGSNPPSVTRISKLCLDGEKLINTSTLAYAAVDSTYVTETNLGLKITRTVDGFTVDTPVGIKKTYKELIPLIWALTEFEDVFHNRIEINYVPQSEITVPLPDGTSTVTNAMLPRSIQYSFIRPSPNMPMFSLYFEYENRNDTIFSRGGLGSSYVTKRIKTIKLYKFNTVSQQTLDQLKTANQSGVELLYDSAATLLRSYFLNYNENSISTVSVLTSVQECGYTADGTQQCLPKLVFSYDQPANNTLTECCTPSMVPTPVSVGQYYPLARRDFLSLSFGDFNGDGITDVFHNLDGNPTELWYGSKSLKFTKTSGPVAWVSNDDTKYQNYLKRINTGDFDGDGKTDILLITSDGEGAVAYNASSVNRATIALSSKNFAYVQTNVPIKIGANNNGYIDTDRVVIADFNGDGKSDIYWKAISADDDYYCDYPPLSDAKVCTWNNLYPANDKLYLSTGDGNFLTLNGLATSIYNSEPEVIAYTPTGDQYVAGMSSNYADIKRLRFGDFNGDGLTDIYVFKGTSTSSATQDDVYLAKSNGVNSVSFTRVNGLSTAIGLDVKISDYVFIDYNGDGITDIYKSTYIDCSTPSHSLCNGSSAKNYAYGRVYSFSESGTPSGAVYDGAVFPAYSKNYNHILFADYNGDQKLDVIRYTDASTFITGQEDFNTGRCWHDYDLTHKFDVYFGQFDATRPTLGHSFQMTSSITVETATPDVLPCLERTSTSAKRVETYLESMPAMLTVGDFDGDGSSDIYMALAGNAQIHRNDLSSPLLSSVSSKTGSTLKISYENFNSAAVHLPNEENKPAYCDKYGIVCKNASSAKVVAATAAENGVGGYNTFRYYYQWMRQHRLGRGGFGFSKSIKQWVSPENPDAFKTIDILDFSQITYINLYNRSAQSAELTYDYFVGTGAATHTSSSFYITYPTALKKLSESSATLNYKITSPVAGVKTVRLYKGESTKIAYEFDDPSNLLSVTERQFEKIDDYGNVLDHLSFRSRSDASSTVTTAASYTHNIYGASDIEQYLGRVKNSYITKFLAIPELVAGETIDSFYSKYFDSQGFLLTKDDSREQRSTSYTYYTNNHVLESTAEFTPNDQEYIKTNYVYDIYGQDLQTTVSGSKSAPYPIEDRVASVARDYSKFYTQGIVTTVVKNALNQTSTATNGLWGEILQVTDLNGLVSTTEFDGLGRNTRVLHADGTVEELERAWCDGVSACPTLAVSYLRTTHYVANNKANPLSPPVVAYYDSLGREVRNESVNFNGLTVFQDTRYDIYGRLWRTSLPYYSASGEIFWSENSYDDAGRLKKILKADGSQIFTNYNFPNPWEVTVTREIISDGVTTTESSSKKPNIIGQDEYVVDDLGEKTSYRYLPFGQLLEVVPQSNAAAKHTFQYDKRCNKIYSNDSDMGAWHYEYDGLGLLRKQTDANGNVTINQYDKLNRLIRQLEQPSAVSGLAAYEFNWCFDDNIACNTQFGSLIVSPPREKSFGALVLETKTLLRSSTASYNYTQEVQRKTYHYDNLSRVISVDDNLEHGLVKYSSSSQFDPITQRLTNVSGQGVTSLFSSAAKNSIPAQAQNFHYNTLGFLESVYDQSDASKPLWTRLDVDENNRTTQYSMHNNVLTYIDYNKLTGAVNAITASKTPNGNEIVDQHYRFDSIGNMVERIDNNIKLNNSAGVTQRYVYDQLNRLNYVLENGITTTQYHYDIAGNLIYNSDVGTMEYSGVGVHQVSRVLASANVATLPGDANKDQRIDSLDVTQIAEEIIQARPVNQFGNSDCDANAAVGLSDTVCVVQKMGAGNVAHSYVYDSNGNLTDDTVSGRKIRYTSFNKPYEISESGLVIGFQYGLGNSRYKQVVNGNTHKTIYYVAGLEIVLDTTDAAKPVNSYKFYISGGSGPMLIRWVNIDSQLTDKVEYLHHDYQGSLVAISDELGTVTQRFYYEPFGKPRQVVQAKDGSFQLNADTALHKGRPVFRGYTGHEHLDEFGLIHMNGRVYDPILGRFLSADPFVQVANDAQSYNRYSYVMNNPMSYTDSSGYLLDQIFGAIDTLSNQISIVLDSYVAPNLVPVGIGILTGLASGSYALDMLFQQEAAGAALLGSVSAAVQAYSNGASNFDIASAAIKSAIMAYLPSKEMTNTDKAILTVVEAAGTDKFFSKSFWMSMTSAGLSWCTSSFVSAFDEYDASIVARKLAKKVKVIITAAEADHVLNSQEEVDPSGIQVAYNDVDETLPPYVRNSHGPGWRLVKNVGSFIFGADISAVDSTDTMGLQSSGFGVDSVLGVTGITRSILKSAAKGAGKLRPWCFIAGTKISTPDGLKNIEDIKKGDLVYAFDQSTNEVVVRKVTNTSHNWTKSLLDLNIDGEIISSTYSHKYWVPEVSKWVPASELSVGTSLQRADGSIAVVAAISTRSVLADVFNFEVEGEHNYFVGEQGYLVHNGAGDNFADYNQARNAALEWLNQRGFKAEAQTIGKFGDNAGKPIGMQTADGKTGFRVEFDKRSGAHINVWSGKEKGPHFKFNGTQSQVNKIVMQFLC